MCQNQLPTPLSQALPVDQGGIHRAAGAARMKGLVDVSTDRRKRYADGDEASHPASSGSAGERSRSDEVEHEEAHGAGQPWTSGVGSEESGAQGQSDGDAKHLGSDLRA